MFPASYAFNRRVFAVSGPVARQVSIAAFLCLNRLHKLDLKPYWFRAINIPLFCPE
jgi:hypothetical protein